MRNRILAAIVLAPLAACVMPGDLEEMQLNLEDVRSGAITVPEYNARQQELLREIEARNEKLKEEAGNIPTDPISLLTYAGGIAGTILGTNKIRDNRRKKRNEPV